MITHEEVFYGGDIDEQIQLFLKRLTNSYINFGCPTHLIELNMPKVAEGLGVLATFHGI